MIISLPFRTLLLSILLFSQLCVGQVVSENLDLFDASRNRQVPCRVYYPEASENSDALWPVVAFGHGFTITANDYSWLGEGLANAGYVVILPNTETQLLPPPNHNAFGLDLVFAATAIVELGNDAESVFFNKVAPAIAIMGHSMGGGATYVGASQATNVQATVTFAAAETNPSAIAAAGFVNVPSLVIASEEDCVTPLNSNQQPIYNALAGTKMLVELDKADHCNYADGGTLCELGEGLACLGFGPFLSRQLQQTRTLQLTKLFLNRFLKNSCPAGDQLDQLSPSISAIESLDKSELFTCSGCGPVGSLSVVQAAADAVELTFTSIASAEGYQIQYKGQGLPVENITVSETSVTIPQLETGVLYRFRVVPFCSGQPGEPSETVSIILPLGTGQEIAAKSQQTNQEASQLIIAPNPASDAAWVVLPGQGNLTVFNALGQIVWQQATASGRVGLPCNSWHDGIYIVRWQSPTGTTRTSRFIAR